MLKRIFVLIIIFAVGIWAQTNTLRDVIPNLPAEHLLRYFNTFPQMRGICGSDEECQVKHANLSKACWGFERNCKETARFKTPTCPGEHSGWAENKHKQLETFYNQADFGYIKQQLHELQLICEPSFLHDSSLECTKYLRFCRGRNLLFDFRDLPMRAEPIRYQMDVLKPGQILGHCRLNETLLKAEMDHMGALQSWAPELRNFKEYAAEALLSSNDQCDLIINKPTFIMKIDASYNMYHHFCDFFNLYISLFVNQSHPLAFDRDVRIIIWETYTYDSPFAVAFKAFSKYPVWTLNEVSGKRVCFKNIVLPLLPRMIFGLYYNTPIIQGCQGSGMFRAFSEFMLHRLDIPQHKPLSPTAVRVTFLLRRTKYRRVLNEHMLIEALNKEKDLHIQAVSFESLSFTEQLAIIRNTDILIGMHGAGLTHLLFLPEWAVVFELHNCEDPNCYKDLARLRGVHYITWQRDELVFPEDEGHHPQGGAHAKFTNYNFDEVEFMRLVHLSVQYVKNHAAYHQHISLHNTTSLKKDEL